MSHLPPEVTGHNGGTDLPLCELCGGAADECDGCFRELCPRHMGRHIATCGEFLAQKAGSVPNAALCVSAGSLDEPL